ncbi:MAG: phosphoribosylformylglycinamidine synthase subunit PurS [Thermoplasmata archaeon]|nr:phosphoribosylformylglycinamidine synthase subunit PurS [Thermoplasmata archaeon]
MYRAEVRIELKPGVADPEGANTKKTLELLGFRGVQSVKAVHAFTLDLDAKSAAEAKSSVDEMCKRLLVNPVIHTPAITLVDLAGKKTQPAAAPKKTVKPAKTAKKAKSARKPAKKSAKKR